VSECLLAISDSGKICAHEAADLDPSIKNYAEALYEKARSESASALRQAVVEHLHEISKRQYHGQQLFSGADFQAQTRLYAAHIERTTAARLHSFQQAFSEINRLPTERELREIVDEFKATWELQITQTSHALSSAPATRNAPVGLDVAASPTNDPCGIPLHRPRRTRSRALSGPISPVSAGALTSPQESKGVS
jgi:hypothetical protein